MPFGERLQGLLARQGPYATQAWLAERTGVDRSLISRIVRGDRPPTFDSLQCFAAALGTDVGDLVRGTDAEPRLRDAADRVRRSDYQEAVAKIIEYESKIRDLGAQVRTATEALKKEHEGRERAEQAAAEAESDRERAEGKLGELQDRFAVQERDLERYKQALAKAVADFSALKNEVDKLQRELGAAKKSSKAGAILAGVAAVTGVATIAHFLGEEPSEPPEQPKPRARSPGRRKRK